MPTQLFNPAAPEGEFQELTFGQQYAYTAGVQAQWDILNFQKKFAAQTASVQLEEARVKTEQTRFNTYNQTGLHLLFHHPDTGSPGDL